MSDKKIEEAPIQSRPPRHGMIELLQVFSLLMLPVAWLLPEGWYRAAAIGLAVVLGVIPFLLVQLPEREPSVTWSHGFKLTPERLRTLEEIGIPHDILQAVETIGGVYYPKSKDLRQALFHVIGKDRVQPWLNLILRHAKYHGAPPAPAQSEKGREQQPGSNRESKPPAGVGQEGASQEADRRNSNSAEAGSLLDAPASAPQVSA